MPKRLICLFLLLCFCIITHAQTAGNSSNGALLYLHTDKTVYTNNEEIWFSGYLINSGTSDIKAHKFMLVSLARQDDNKILIHQKFIMEDGFSNGNIHLPDSIPPGDYQLMAYTNPVDKFNKPLDVFTQQLTVKSVNQETINANISLVDTVADKEGNYHVVLFAQPKAADKQLKPEVSYHTGNTAAIKVKQDILGKYEMLIPAKSINNDNPVLYAEVKYGKEFRYLSIKLPKATPKLNIRFYPEGGNISANMLNTIGIEARAGNTPVNMFGVLLKDNIAVDTIHTNYAGMARFRLFNNGKSTYTFRELKNGKLGTAVYPLPTALNNKLVLNIPKAVCDDTVKYSIAAAVPQLVHIIVRDQQREYLSFDHPLKKGKNDFADELEDMPVGTATITVLDSLQHPIAERLFFAHYNRRPIAEIKTDKANYAKREQVNVTISLKDPSTGQPVSALVSLAAIQGNRLEAYKAKDIDSYVYLYHGLNDSLKNGQVNLKDRKSLEDILLIRGWRRYTWQDSIRQKDSLNSLAFTGKITRNGKPLTKTMLLNIIKSNGIANVTSDEKGFFSIQPDLMYAAYDNKLMVLPMASNREGLDITFNDPYELLNNTLIRQTPAIGPLDFVMNTSSGYLTNDLKTSRKLKEVVIKGNKDDQIFNYKILANNTNNCGDWVCFNNVLNCSNHPNGTLPLLGMHYTASPGNPHMRGGRYIGCPDEKVGNGIVKIEGIYLGREFYGLTKSDLDVAVPQYVSTLYWNPAIIVNDTGTASFSYFNGDITGTFKIILQGVSSQGVFSGSYSYNVSP